jgi:hypothetical protein
MQLVRRARDAACIDDGTEHNEVAQFHQSLQKMDYIITNHFTG